MKGAVCRGCGKVLVGKPYHLGGQAFDPDTKEWCRVNHYGGYVCSEHCDRRICLEMESNMPGAGPARFVSCFAAKTLQNNWH